MEPLPAIWHYGGHSQVPAGPGYPVAVVGVVQIPGLPGIVQAVFVDATGALRTAPIAELQVVGTSALAAITEAQAQLAR